MKETPDKLGLAATTFCGVDSGFFIFLKKNRQ